MDNSGIENYPNDANYGELCLSALSPRTGNPASSLDRHAETARRPSASERPLGRLLAAHELSGGGVKYRNQRE